MNKTMITAFADDGACFSVEKLQVHRLGLRHLAVSVFVFCGEELLLQRRAAEKYHSGLLWANTCCSHPVWGESVEACAHRRLEEELGIHLSLQPAGRLDYTVKVGHGMIECEHVHFFVGECEKDKVNFTPDPREVVATCWVTLNDLRHEIRMIPSLYAPWLRIYLERAQETGIKRLLPLEPATLPS